jgi:uncharacterized protein involved in exopolysaccharide biosynthesis
MKPALPSPSGKVSLESNRGVSSADVISIALAALRRRWFILVAGICCSAVLTIVLPRKMASYSYEARASLLHTNLPIPEAQKVYYQPPDLKTVIALFSDRDTLNRLKGKEKLEVPLKLLEKSITAEVATGTKAIKVSLGWANGEDAVRMLRETITIVSDTLDEIRIEKLENHVTELETERAERADGLNKATVKLDAFHSTNNITELDADLDRLQLQVAEKDLALEAAERNAADIKAQQDRLAQYMTEVKRREAEDAVEEKQFEAAAETVSDNRRRQDRLRELIYEERRVQEVQAKIAAKKAEYLRLEALRKKGFASAHEMDGLKGELAALEAQIQASDKISAWEKELGEIDTVVVPKNAKKNVGSPIIQQTLFRELELTLAKLAADVQIRMIKEARDKTLAEKNRLIGLRIDYEDLKRDLVSAQDAERSAADRIQILKSLARIRNSELVVLAEPEIAPEGTKSNKKLLMLAGMVGGFLPAVALTGVLEGVDWIRRQARSRVLLPLPVLGRFQRPAEVSYRTAVPSDDARLLAMKIRKLKPEYGATIAFAGIDRRSRGLSSLVSEIALSLSRRDERLLILDTRGIEDDLPTVRTPHVKMHEDESPVDSAGTQDPSKSADPAIVSAKSSVLQVSRVMSVSDDGESLAEGDREEAGLSDYLGFVKLTLDEITLPGPGYGIDVIAPGRVRLHAEALATHRMRQAVQEMRSKYSMILVLTAGLADAVSVATVMEHIDGAVVVANEDRPGPEASAGLESLADEHVEVFGQVILQTADESHHKRTGVR